MIDKGWVAAGDLIIGDKVHTLNGGIGTVIGLELEKLDKPTLVYNLEVGDFHSYFVGDGILVHNEYYRSGVVRDITESSNATRMADRLSGGANSQLQHYLHALIKLGVGDYEGLNVHRVGGNEWSADLKGFGGGRGPARIFFLIHEFTIEILRIQKSH